MSTVAARPRPVKSSATTHRRTTAPRPAVLDHYVWVHFFDRAGRRTDSISTASPDLLIATMRSDGIRCRQGRRVTALELAELRRGEHVLMSSMAG